MKRVERRLAAILAADVAGYSRLMGADEEGTLARLKAHRRELIDPKISEHRGRIVKTTGDGLLVEFSSVVDALRCATEIQRGMAEGNSVVPADGQIEFRIGIHQSDVVVEDGDIFGDGVNVAARLEGLAEPGGICVSARVQEDAAGKLALVFEDMGEQELKNIARPLRVYRIQTGVPASESRQAPLPLPDKPSIAVMPFANMSGDPEQEYFADGMVEEIITALSQIRWLFVIARNSSFTYKGQAVGVKQVGRELGVRYVLEGSVRKAGGRVRITAQLIDALTGAHLWADRFDGSLEDVFDLQDKVALSVAGVIEPTLQTAESLRLGDRPSTDLSAYELYLRALPDFHSYERARILRALQLLNAAIARDQRYGPALALGANCHLLIAANGWSEDASRNGQCAVDLARQALQANADDPGVLTASAVVLAAFGESIDTSTALIDRALEANPSSALGWFRSGVIRVFEGRPDIAVEHFERSLRLSPLGRMAIRCRAWLGMAQFFDRRFDQALANLLTAQEEVPDWLAPRRALVSCYAQLGRLKEAREMAMRLEATGAVLVPPEPFFGAHRNSEQRNLLLGGLRLAAGEET
jgi:TolB-like protein/class 3 adenylate cyclase/Flp pilus assembly protein TadD